MSDLGDVLVTTVALIFLLTLAFIGRDALDRRNHGVAVVYLAIGLNIARWLLVRIGTNGGTVLVRDSAGWVQFLSDDLTVAGTMLLAIGASVFGFVFRTMWDLRTELDLRNKDDKIKIMESNSVPGATQQQVDESPRQWYNDSRKTVKLHTQGRN